MVVVIRETQKMESTIDHVLTDEQYKIFRTLKGNDRTKFVVDLNAVMTEEEIVVVGQSSKFKLRKDLTETEKILANRMADKL